MKSYKKQKPKKTPKQKGGNIPSHLLYPLISLIGAVAGRLIYKSFENQKNDTVDYSPKQHNQDLKDYYKKINKENPINYGTQLDDNTLVYDSSMPFKELQRKIAEQRIDELTKIDSNLNYEVSEELANPWELLENPKKITQSASAAAGGRKLK